LQLRIDQKKGELYNPRLVAAVAQLVEQRIRNAKVTSSIPVSGTKTFKGLAFARPLLFLPLSNHFEETH
jgi:hypothetical protein